MTCLVGLFMAYWVTVILGVVGVDALDVDLDADFNADGVDGDSGDAHGGVPGPIAAVLRFINAADVPLMAVLTMQSVYMWVMTMMANYYYNGELKDWLIITFFILAFFVGLVLTKISTLPLVPLFKKMKKLAPWGCGEVWGF